MEDYSITSQPVQYFLEKRELISVFVNDKDPDHIHRWIEHKGWLVSAFFNDVTIINCMGRQETLHNCLCFGTDRRKCMRTKSRLNSEIVRQEEPELWRTNPNWQKAYSETHRRM